MIQRNDLESQFERLPPHNDEAEKCALASMMLDADVRSECLMILDREMWFSADHQIIFDIIAAMHEKGRPIDALTVREELEKRQLLSEIGGTAALGEMLNMLPSGAHGAHYSTIVRDKSLLRQIISASNENLRDAYAPHEDVQEVCHRTETRTLAITERRVSDKPKLIQDALIDAYESYEQKATRGIETGFFEIDDMLNGLQAGEMIVVGARPSQGKTAFAIDVMTRVARSVGPVLMFSLEMGRQAISQRILCSVAGVDSQKMRRGLIGQDDYKRMADALHQMDDAPIYVDDCSSITTLHLHAKTRLIRRQRPDLKLIVIDYLQLIESPQVKESRQQQITQISRAIKSLARETNLPVVVLSQLNRQSEGRESHRPRMSDLRESGSIEQDADVVMLLHREDYYRLQEPNFVPDNIAEIIIAKQRNGPTGTVKLTFDSRATTFRNLSAQQSDIFQGIP